MHARPFIRVRLPYRRTRAPTSPRRYDDNQVLATMTIIYGRQEYWKYTTNVAFPHPRGHPMPRRRSNGRRRDFHVLIRRLTWCREETEFSHDSSVIKYQVSGDLKSAFETKRTLGELLQLFDEASNRAGLLTPFSHDSRRAHWRICDMSLCRLACSRTSSWRY